LAVMAQEGGSVVQ